MSNAESFTGGDIDIAAIKLPSRSKTNSVNDPIQAVPLFAEFGEDVFNFFVTGHIAREAKAVIRAPAGCKFGDAIFELFILVGERKFSAFAVHGFGDT